MGKGGAQCGKMVKGRSKERSEDAANRMRWLQEQAANRMRARDALKMHRDKAAAEAALSRKHNLKIMAEMRTLMRGEKLQHLKKELEALAALHEETLKRKDMILDKLVESLDFAYDQHSVRRRFESVQTTVIIIPSSSVATCYGVPSIFRTTTTLSSSVGFEAAAMSQMDNLERLIRLQDQRLLLSERQFEADLKVLVDEFDDEREEIIAAHEAETAELSVIHHQIENEEHEEGENVGHWTNKKVAPTAHTQELPLWHHLPVVVGLLPPP